MIDDILICIYNYRHDETAREWKSILSPHFNTVVLDSGNDKKCEDFIQYPNIYYSGLFNETKKLSKSGKYKWIGVIPSDITIEKQYVYFLIEKIKWLKTTKDIGIWQPSLDANSRDWLGNIHTNKYGMEKKKLLEAHIFFIRYDILKDVPYIDMKENKYGYGISEVLSGMSLKKRMNNVFDNTLQVHHPEETKYDRSSAARESIKWTPSICKKLDLDYSYLTKNDNNSFGPYDGNGEKIIITMTTWKKRIDNIPVILDTIFEQTILPDKIVINLSSAEFTNKECDFSDKVKEYLNAHNEDILINWIDGPNIKSWKKTIPTFKLFPNDAIICIDDDILYKKDFIESLYTKHLSNPGGPIVWATYIQRGGFYQHCGCATLDKSEYYPNDIEKFLCTDITKYPDEDSFMTYMSAKNGTPNISMGSWIELHTYNDVEPISKGHRDGEALKWVEDYYGEPIDNIYNKLYGKNKRVNKKSQSVIDSKEKREDLLTIYAGKNFSYPYKSSNLKTIKCEDECYSKGFNELIDIIMENNSKWILFIKDSVRFVGTIPINTRIDSIIKTNSNIGLYTPSSLYIYQNSLTARKKSSGLRSVNEISDDIFLINTDALNGLKKIDFSKCFSGAGFIRYLCSLVKSNGYSIVIDDSCCYTKNFTMSISNEMLENHAYRLITDNGLDFSILKTTPNEIIIDK